MAQSSQTVIQKDTTVIGAIRNCRQIEVHGYIEGELIADELIVHEGGRLHGKVRTVTADVRGTLQGNVVIKNLITIRSSGAVNGEVQYGQLAMEMGGELSAELRNAPPRLAGDLKVSVTRGRSVLITTEDISAFDHDDKTKDIILNVSNVKNGFLALAPSKNTQVSSFSQADIESSRVLFVHDGSNGALASFDIVASDPKGAISGDPLTVDITVVSRG
ncbi:MAG: polymer-forming cytoskeletal protein [Hyphomicrobiales bacterium]|nr:polymer-forming cytoskeletal protein [Hyphomicrobiales bacterium]